MSQAVTKVDFTSEQFEKQKAIQVDKLLELNIDLGTLLAIDTNDLNKKKFKLEKENYLLELSREGCQLLLNKVWELPVERYEDALVATLGEPGYRLPREKPVPKPKPLTKWQQYAKDKGLRTTKKSNLKWDETLKRWVPRHGYKRATAEREKDWVVEIPDQADPYLDYFQKKQDDKKEKVSKNEFQRLRNLAKAKKIKVPTMGLPPTQNLSALQLNSAAQIANVSTASVGKFQPRVSKERTLSKASILVKKKRKTPYQGAEDERRRDLNVAEQVLNKRPRLDLGKVVNRQIYQEQTEESERKKGGGGGKGRKKGKGMGGGKRRQNKAGDKKPSKGKGGQGVRKFQQGGRKRR